jgi:hypothetical protein
MDETSYGTDDRKKGEHIEWQLHSADGVINMSWQDRLKNSLQHFVSSYLFELKVGGLDLTSIHNLVAFISWFFDSTYCLRVQQFVRFSLRRLSKYANHEDRRPVLRPRYDAH